MNRFSQTIDLYSKKSSQHTLFIVGETFAVRVVNSVGVVEYTVDNNQLLIEGNETSASQLDIGVWDEYEGETELLEEDIELKLYRVDTDTLVMEGYFNNRPISLYHCVSTEKDFVYCVNRYVGEVSRQNDVKSLEELTEFGLDYPSDSDVVLQNLETNVGRVVSKDQVAEWFDTGRLRGAIKLT